MKFYCHLNTPHSIPCHKQCILCERYEKSLNDLQKDFDIKVFGNHFESNGKRIDPLKIKKRSPDPYYYEDEDEILDCPKCGRSYDDADSDFLICHHCGFDADK